MQIVNGSQLDPPKYGTIGISTDGVTYDYITKESVQKIGGIYLPNPVGGYKYSTKTILRIELVSGVTEYYEVQNVSNQPSWSTGDQAGLDNAMNDIAFWLEEKAGENYNHTAKLVDSTPVDFTGDVSTNEGADILGINITNTTAAVAYVKLFDHVHATPPSVGSDIPNRVIPVAAHAGFNVPVGKTSQLEIVNDLWIAVTANPEYTDNTNVASKLIIEIDWA